MFQELFVCFETNIVRVTLYFFVFFCNFNFHECTCKFRTDKCNLYT